VSSFFSRANADIPLDPGVVLFGDPRWETALSELKTALAFGFDIETYGHVGAPRGGLDPFRAEVRLIQVGLLSGLSIIADLGGYYDDREKILKRYNQLFSILKVRLEKAVVCGTSLIFDSKFVLVKYGWRIKRIRDLKLLSQVLWAGVGAKTNPRLAHSLKAIVKRCLNVDLDKEEQKEDWGGKLFNKHYNYGAGDVQYPLKCVPILVEKLRKTGALRSGIIECESTCVFAEMEAEGQPCNKAQLDLVTASYQKAFEHVLDPFLKEFPGINPWSLKQLGEALSLRYPEENFTGAGALDDSAIATLASRIPALNALSEARALKKAIEYIEKLNKFYVPVPEWGEGWGIIRTVYKQISSSDENGDSDAGAGMGRTSCGEKEAGPNFQTTPKLQPAWKRLGLQAIRSVIQAPPGFDFLVADLSQCHARVAAKVSGDPYLAKAYVEDYDVHSSMAADLAKLTGLGPEWTATGIKKWDKDHTAANHSAARALRDASKNCYYGSQNIQAWYTLQATCAGAPEPVFLNEEECRFLIQRWRTLYAGLYRFQRATIDLANSRSVKFDDIGVPGVYGYIIGPTDRVLYLEKVISKYSTQLEVRGPDAVSFTWMGAEADIIKRIGALIYERRKSEWKLTFRNMAHDEYNFLVLKQYALEAATLVLSVFQEVMRDVVDPIPPDSSDAKPEKLIVRDWSEK